MAFLRTKTIKGQKYYYLVENRRVGKKVVQKVLKYIGKADNLLNIDLKELKSKKKNEDR